MGSFRCGIRETFTQGRSYVASARALSCAAGAGAGVGAGSSSMGSAISTALHTRSCAPHAPQGFPRPSGWSPSLADKPLGRVRTAELATRYGSRCAVRACAAATQPRTTIVAACSARPTDLCDAVMPRYGCREFQQRGNSCNCSNLNTLGNQITWSRVSAAMASQLVAGPRVYSLRLLNSFSPCHFNRVVAFASSLGLTCCESLGATTSLTVSKSAWICGTSSVAAAGSFPIPTISAPVDAQHT